MPYFSFDKIIIGPVALHVWGICVALAFLLAYLFLLRKSKERGIEGGFIHTLFIVVLLGAALGSKLLGQGGLSIFGGMAAGVALALLYLKLTGKLHLFWVLADTFALIAPLSIAVGRVGCFLINDHQGAETSLPWGIMWPDGVMRHPVALYLIISALTLFFIVRCLNYRFKASGQLFLAFLFLYSFSRFFLDFTRSTGTSLSDPHYLDFSTSQWCFFLTMVGIIIARKIIYDNKKHAGKN